MDIMEPKLVWVEELCYRFTDSDIWIPRDNAAVSDVIEINQKASDNVDKKTLQPDIQPDASGNYCHLLYIPRRYHPFIIGIKRTKLDKIEQVTKTTISIPKKFESHDCVIKGSNSALIVDAMDQINRIIEHARMIIDPTHFLSISMTDETIKSNFVKFRDDVLNECNSNAGPINKTVFKKPEKLHLNLGMLLLVDDNEIKAAVEALAEWKKTIIMPLIERNEPIKLKVEGLDCVQEDHSLATVIYAKVSSENNKLQEFADRTEQFFVQKGLMIVPKNRMKLHMTLMSFPPAVIKRVPHLDIKKNIQDFMMAHEDHFFGETVLDSFYLSQRHKYNENQYYATVEKIDLQ